MIVQLESGRNAAILKVEYLFWKTLVENNEKFEKVFLDSGTNAYGAISEFATWDTRSTEKRFVDLPKRPTSDILLTLNQDNKPLLFSYPGILNGQSETLMESCFARALGFPEAV